MLQFKKGNAVSFVAIWLLLVQHAASWSFNSKVFRRQVAAASFGLVTTIGATPTYALDDATTSAISNVLRVSYSLKNVDETIEGGSDVKLVVSQISALQRNYKLKDNLNLALSAVPDGKRDTARGFARTAVEDLSLVTEYYTDDVNDMTGKKTPPKEVLSLAQSATKATRGELESFFQLLPGEVISPLRSSVGEEFTFVPSK